MQTREIVFIHGMYMTPLCWENWIDYYQSKGYRCRAPAWPGREESVETQRRKHPDPELGRLKLRDVVGHMEAVIKSMTGKPVVIGHSMGGLAAQLLLQKDLAAAVVAIDPAAPQGVWTFSWSYVRANFPHINPLVPVTRPIEMSFPAFQYAFVNTLPVDQQRSAYDRYVVPESRGVPTESLTSVAHIDFQKPHAPLLITAGEQDHLIPASLNRATYRRYSPNGSVTDFKVFPGRDHFVIGEPGWQEVADFILSWLDQKAAS
ncbi:MAG TPA: alpha/beta hydrolase [Anaerolineales bacterium]